MSLSCSSTAVRSLASRGCVCDMHMRDPDTCACDPDVLGLSPCAGLGGGSGAEFVTALCTLFVKNVTDAEKAVAAKLNSVAADGKVSLAQARDAIEAVEIGPGNEQGPLIGVCGGSGRLTQISLCHKSRRL